MNIWQSFKKWALRPEVETPEIPALLPKPHVEYCSMVGEPVTSFIASLRREPKRYKLERTLRLNPTEFPEYTQYHWMHGAGHYTLTDKKTGNVYAAYVHESDRVYDVYGLPFKLNHWELVALWKEFQFFRAEARARKESIDTYWVKRARLAAEAQEKLDRQRFADQFK